MTLSASADLELMRASLLLESDPREAARRATDILAASPEHTEAMLLLATASRKLGDTARASELLESVTRSRPDSAFLQLELGRAYVADGRSAEAVVALRRAVALDAAIPDAWKELARQLFAIGESKEGDTADARYRHLWRESHEIGDANKALAENRVEAAEAILRRRLQQVPDDEVAMRMLADAALRREDQGEAERWLMKCLVLAPGYSAARGDLARLLFGQQRVAEMLPVVERLLASEPDNVDWLSLKAAALRLVGRNDEAIALLERVVAANPGNDESWLLCGHVLREVGQQARAIEMFRRAIAARSACGRAYSSLGNLKTFRFANEDLAAIREQLKQTALSGEDRKHFEFALGKALEDAGDFASSFRHYARGNALHRATTFYDPNAVTAETQRQKALYTARFFAERAGWGSDRQDPIFIVGLPRSGSTLLEQMLASHSQVEGTRELLEIAAIAFELWSRMSPAERAEYPRPIAALGRQEIEACAQRYLSRTQPYRLSGRPRFVDKMLGNFGNIGLIHLMFPRAAIIDVRRHPLACGFSCYKQLFNRGQKFTYELREFGRYYRDYVALMEHLETVLPGRVYRLHYEQLVADPEGELRKVLDHCGLPFEEQCLRFYENPRVVHTISSEQVRQPIYSGSVDQWRHYEPWLDPLKDVLGDLVDRYPRAAAGAS